MRKLLMISNVMLLGIIFFISCNKQDSLQPTTTGTDAGKGHPNGQSTASREDCPSCYNYDGIPMAGLNSGTAYSVAQHYRNTNLEVINANFEPDDSKCVWFSVEALENFLWKIKKAGCDNECPTGLSLGVRIYFGKYSSNTLGGLPADYNERHTVFMVPTFQDEANDQIHWDFDPWHWGPPGCRPVSLSRWFSSTGSPKPFQDNSLILSIDDQQYEMNPNGDVVSSFNHGNMLPPENATGAMYFTNFP